MPEAARLIIQRASESSQGVPALVEKLTAFLATHEAENNLP